MSRLNTRLVRAEIDTASFARAQAEWRGDIRRIRQETRFAISYAMTDVQKRAAKVIAEKVYLKRSIIRRAMTNVKPTTSNLVGEVVVKYGARTGLEHFGARHVGAITKGKKRRKGGNARGGVTYRISRTGGRQFIRGAFTVASWAEQTKGSDGEVKFGPAPVFKRKPGIGRGPLKGLRLYGITSWGVLIKNNALPGLAEYAAERLAYQLDRRIRLSQKRAAGIVPQRGGTP